MSAIANPADQKEDSILLAAQDDFFLRFEQWDKEHAKMRARPPKQAKNYVKHARNLLPLLENVAELHPVAKAVVFSFRAVIEFQYDRIENDVRVYNVFLTASDMMRQVLEIDILTRRNDRDIIDSNRHLQDRLRIIAADIKECGNAIDTYYKESKLVKFLKAKEWRESVAEFNQTFMEHRTALTQALSIRTAFGVDDLHTKMDSLCAAIFTEHEYERQLQQQIRQFGISKDKWIQDPDKLQKLYEIIHDDPMVDLELFDKDETHSGQGGGKDARYRLLSHMAWLKEETETDIKTLCARNKDVFMKKMDFQTAQIQEAISNSAAYIVGQLLGPYDRLKHDDLRTLWKEMNWLFCVDSKVFAMALYEYYLDLFSTMKPSSEDGSTSRHRDLWTLDYFLAYGEQICSAVDTDTSGYIRISEVNAFTEQMPKGWSLPEWCVYHALGWHYEQHLYQKRLLHLLDVFYEAQVFVTPWNRASITFYIGNCLGFIHNLARGPRIRDYAVLPEPMLELIRQKVETESHEYRGHFKTLHGHLDSADTVKMIYRNRPLETYTLQLCVFILESCTDVTQICQTQTVDLRQWVQLDDTIDTVRLMTMNRIGYWEATFRDKQQDADSKMDNHYGGLYRICFLENVQKQPDCAWSDVEIRERLDNFYLLSDIPWPPPHQGDPNEVLSFRTWEDLHPDADPEVRPPVSWPENEEEARFYAKMAEWRKEWMDDFPSMPVGCNNCSKFPFHEARYNCLDCDDFDLCHDCFCLPFESLDDGMTKDAGHLRSHTFLKQALFFHGPYYRWVEALCRYTGREVFKRGYYLSLPGGTINSPGTGNAGEGNDSDGESEGEDEGGSEDEAQKGDEGEGDDDDPPVSGWDIICDVCHTNARSGRYFMECLHPLCSDLDICQECAEKNDFPHGPHLEQDYLDNESPDLDTEQGNPDEDNTVIGHGAEGEDDDAGVKAEAPSDDEGEEEDGDGNEDDGEEDDHAGSAVSGTHPPESVAPTNQEKAAPIHHRSWHTTIVIPLVEHQQPGDGVTVKEPNPQIDAPKDDDRIARLENRMEGLEKNMSQLRELLLEVLGRLK